MTQFRDARTPGGCSKLGNDLNLNMTSRDTRYWVQKLWQTQPLEDSRESFLTWNHTKLDVKISQWWSVTGMHHQQHTQASWHLLTCVPMNRFVDQTRIWFRIIKVVHKLLVPAISRGSSDVTTLWSWTLPHTFNITRIYPSPCVCRQSRQVIN